MNRPQGTLQLPPQMSTIAPDVDHLYNLIYWVSVVSFVLITGVMLAYVLLYRRRVGVKPEPTGHNTALEIFWTFTPLLLLGYLFHEGFAVFLKGSIPPENAIEIRVQGQQWSWAFEHPNGTGETNELHVPAHVPVKMIMSSVDVIHSFFVPEFRVKRDVVPGMFTTVWFEATQETEEDHPVTLFCAEYCGAPAGITASSDRNTNHSTMLANIHVRSEQWYSNFLAEGPPAPKSCEGRADAQACWGETLYNSAGCKACHNTAAGIERPAPTWFGIFGRTSSFEDGGSQKVDENYIAQSIRQPQAHIVRGYSGVNMPPYRLSDRQIAAITSYMKTLH